MEHMTLSDQAVYFLADTRKWARFMAIIGYILIGFLVLGAIVMAAIFDSLTATIPNYPVSGTFLAVLYIAMALIYFFPVYYLDKFSVKMKYALNSGEESQLTESFQWLRAHYRFIGILTIVLLALYALAFIVGIFAGVVGAFMV
jgi:hypothetical protein